MAARLFFKMSSIQWKDFSVMQLNNGSNGNENGGSGMYSSACVYPIQCLLPPSSVKNVMRDNKRTSSEESRPTYAVHHVYGHSLFLPFFQPVEGG